MTDGYSLLLPFDTDDEAFTRGVEVGRMWEIANRLAEHEAIEPVSETVHATNAEMVLRIAEALDLHVRSEIADGHWMHVTFSHEPIEIEA